MILCANSPELSCLWSKLHGRLALPLCVSILLILVNAITKSIIDDKSPKYIYNADMDLSKVHFGQKHFKDR